MPSSSDRSAGKLRERLPVATVRRADLHLGLLVEHVELGEGEGVEAVHADRVAHDDRVEPSAASRAAGGGAVLVPALADLLLERAADLGGQRSGAHAGGVGLGDAQHAVDARGRDAEAGERAPGRRRRRGHERVGPVVDVEQRGLRAFEEDRVALRDLALHDDRGVADARPQPLAEPGQVADQRVPVDVRLARRESAADCLVVRRASSSFGAMAAGRSRSAMRRPRRPALSS